MTSKETRWISILEQTPDDGDVITLLRHGGDNIIEIAPWRNGEYQGDYYRATYNGVMEVTHWLPMPPIPEHNI